MSADRFTLRNVYLYIVCLITLVITIFAGVSLVRNAVALAYPEPVSLYFPEGVDRQEQESQRKAFQDSQRRSAVLGLVTGGTLLLISVPTYAYHWRQIQSDRPARRRDDTGPADGDR